MKGPAQVRDPNSFVVATIRPTCKFPPTMTSGEIDLGPLEKALSRLSFGIERATDNPDDEELRDAVIQRFEYSFELSWKMLRRVLAGELPVPAEAAALSYRDLIREAARRGFLDDPQSWFVYREQRNLTSHTYDGEKAVEVFETALEFLPSATELLARLRDRVS